MNRYLEEAIWSLYQTGQKLRILPNCFSDNFWLIDRGHDSRHGIRNDPICIVYLHVSEFAQKVEDYKT